LVLILSTCHTRVVLQGIIHVCNFFFNHNVYKMILLVFSSWVCDLLDIIKINLSTIGFCVQAHCYKQMVQVVNHILITLTLNTLYTKRQVV